MNKNPKISIGSLVFPIEDRCGRWLFPKKYKRGTFPKKEFIYNGAIPVCEEPNRERPIRKSSDMLLGTPGTVVERFESRYPMLKIVTVTASGNTLIGWVLESDVAVADESGNNPNKTS